MVKRKSKINGFGSVGSINGVLNLSSSQCPANNAPVHAGTVGRAGQIRASSPCSRHTPRFFTTALPPRAAIGPADPLARGQPRCAHRARFAGEVHKDRLDHHRVFDARDDAHRAAARCPGLDVDAEHALQALCPAHCRVALARRSHTRVRTSAFADSARPLSRPALVTNARCALFGGEHNVTSSPNSRSSWDLISRAKGLSDYCCSA
jgi:hypothetical protein